MRCKGLEENLNRLGRVACIKLNNPIDAIAMLVGALKVVLPLNNGCSGAPIIYPTASFLKFIEDFDSLSFNIEPKNLGKNYNKKPI